MKSEEGKDSSGARERMDTEGCKYEGKEYGGWRGKGRKEAGWTKGEAGRGKRDIRVITPNVIPPYFQSFYSSC